MQRPQTHGQRQDIVRRHRRIALVNVKNLPVDQCVALDEGVEISVHFQARHVSIGHGDRQAVCRVDLPD